MFPWALYNLIHFLMAALEVNIPAVLHGTGWHTICHLRMIQPRPHAHYRHGAPVFRLICTAYIGG